MRLLSLSPIGMGLKGRQKIIKVGGGILKKSTEIRNQNKCSIMTTLCLSKHPGLKQYEIHKSWQKLVISSVYRFRLFF